MASRRGVLSTSRFRDANFAISRSSPGPKSLPRSWLWCHTSTAFASRMTTSYRGRAGDVRKCDPPEPTDEHDRKLLADVERHGWHVVCVEEDEEGPGFAYSI